MGNFCGQERENQSPQQSRQQQTLLYRDLTITIIQGNIEDEKTNVILNASENPQSTNIYKKSGLTDSLDQLKQGEPILIKLSNTKCKSEYFINLRLPTDYEEQKNNTRSQAYQKAFKIANDTFLETLSYNDNPSSSIETTQDQNAESFFEGLIKFLNERQTVGLKVVKLVNLDPKSVKIYQDQLNGKLPLTAPLSVSQDPYGKVIGQVKLEQERKSLRESETLGFNQSIRESNNVRESNNLRESNNVRESKKSEIQNQEVDKYVPVIVTKIEDKCDEQNTIPEGVNVIQLQVEQPKEKILDFIPQQQPIKEIHIEEASPVKEAPKIAESPVKTIEQQQVSPVVEAPKIAESPVKTEVEPIKIDVSPVKINEEQTSPVKQAIQQIEASKKTIDDKPIQQSQNASKKSKKQPKTQEDVQQVQESQIDQSVPFEVLDRKVEANETEVKDQSVEQIAQVPEVIKDVSQVIEVPQSENQVNESIKNEEVQEPAKSEEKEQDSQNQQDEQASKQDQQNTGTQKKGKKGKRQSQ